MKEPTTHNPQATTRVVVAMSGGVDSSTAAGLLKERGYDVIGVSMHLWDYTDGERDRFGSCCTLEDIYDARGVAYALGIPHYVLNMEDVFTKEVVDYFVDTYLKGETPNPCLKCNQVLKFDVLLRKAMALGADYLATGHYARVEYDGERDRYLLLKGRDEKKDQSYFLFTLTQRQLSRVIFPLGDLTKADVRAMAKRLGLKVAEKGESQEICFVEADYPTFISRRISMDMEGEIVDGGGNIIGRHNGLFRYTIGQRKGLGVAKGEPLYVLEIDRANNRLIVGPEARLFSKGLIARDVNWIGVSSLSSPMEVETKVRYRHHPAGSIITPIRDNMVEVLFKEPQRAITPGQAVVFYRGDEVLGGGWIEKTGARGQKKPKT